MNLINNALIVFVLFWFASCQSAESLNGSWRAVADQLLDSSGKVISQDKDIEGLLIYTAEGKMSVQLRWNNTRSALMTDSIMQRDGFSAGLGLGSNTWTLDQSRKMIDSYDAYFGDFKIDAKEHIVTHVIDANLRPEKSGTSYRRRYLIKNDSLFLKSTDTTLRWQMAFVKIK